MLRPRVRRERVDAGRRRRVGPGDNGYLNALDASTGERVYSQSIRPTGFDNTGLGTVGPMVSHGYLVVSAFGMQVFSVPRA